MTTFCAPCLADLALVREAVTAVAGTSSCMAHAVLLSHPGDTPQRRLARLSDLRTQAEGKLTTASADDQPALELLVQEYALAGAMDMSVPLKELAGDRSPRPPKPRRNRPGRGERPEGERGDRPERGERPDRGDRPERGERRPRSGEAGASTNDGGAPAPSGETSAPASSTPAPSGEAPSTPAPSTPAPSGETPSTPAPSTPAPSSPAPGVPGPVSASVQQSSAAESSVPGPAEQAGPGE